jgi:predicted aldo/keto reductase-like oxidoreductase
MQSNGPNRLMVNRYVAAGELSKKDVFSNFMTFCQEIYPEEFDFVPATFNLPSEKEAARFKAYKKRIKSQKPIFIAKPSAGSQGDNI